MAHLTVKVEGPIRDENIRLMALIADWAQRQGYRSISRDEGKGEYLDHEADVAIIEKVTGLD